MASWLDRAKRLSSKSAESSADQPAIDKVALAKSVADAERAAALKTEKQKAIRDQIAGVVVGVLTELNNTLGGEMTPPTVEEHHKRMLSVSTEVRNKPILVNVLSLSTGKTRITCYVGRDGDGDEREFEEKAIKEEISEWLGGEIVGELESDYYG